MDKPSGKDFVDRFTRCLKLNLYGFSSPAEHVISVASNKHPRVKRVVFQMRAKPFVPRRHVKRVSTTCQLRKMAFFTSRDTVFTKIKKLLFT